MIREAIISAGLWDGEHEYTGGTWSCKHCGHSSMQREVCAGPVDDVDILARTLVSLCDEYIIEVQMEGVKMVYRLTHFEGSVCHGSDDLRDVLTTAIEWELANG